VFKVGLLGEVLGVSLLCVSFGDEFAKVVEIAKDVMGPLCVLFGGGAAFAQLVEESAEDALGPVCVSFKGVFVEIARDVAFRRAFLTLLGGLFTPFSNPG
jgi:hypothetical protein